MIPPPSKNRSDSTIDSQLDPHQADLFFERLANGLSLREGVAWLLAEHGITLSEMSLSRWAAKRRRARAEEAFAVALETLRADRAQAAALLDGTPEKPVDAADEFAQASLLLANHALFVAQRDGEAARIAQAARTVTALRNAQTHAQRADNSRRAAETTQRRHEYAAAREAILYEHERGLLDAPDACEEMRAAYDQAFCSSPSDEAPAPPPVGHRDPRAEESVAVAPKTKPQPKTPVTRPSMTGVLT